MVAGGGRWWQAAAGGGGAGGNGGARRCACLRRAVSTAVRPVPSRMRWLPPGLLRPRCGRRWCLSWSSPPCKEASSFDGPRSRGRDPNCLLTLARGLVEYFSAWGRSSAGRALPSHGRGRGFDSLRLHHKQFNRTRRSACGFVCFNRFLHPASDGAAGRGAGAPWTSLLQRSTTFRLSSGSIGMSPTR